MTGLSRRDVIAATLATVTAGMPARAQEPRSSTLYFVPGGRIGFQRPATIKPLSDSWHLPSKDHTFEVRATEALRIDAEWDDRMWQPDDHALVAAGYLSPGIERRHFRSTRYGRSADYRADTHVFRDDRWIGKITVSTSTLGSPLLANGQIARWRDVIDALVASLTVRPSPPVSEALAELRVQLTLEGLNPRSSLSLQADWRTPRYSLNTPKVAVLPTPAKPAAVSSASIVSAGTHSRMVSQQ